MWFNENIEDGLWFKAEGEPLEKSRETRSRGTEKSDLRKQSGEDIKVSYKKEKHLGSTPPTETMCECHRCNNGNPVSTQVPMGSTWGNVPCGCPYTINGISGWRKLNFGQNPCEMTNCYNCSTGQVVQRPIGTCLDMLTSAGGPWTGPVYSGSTPPNLNPPCIVNP